MTRSSKVAAAAIVTVLALIATPRPAAQVTPSGSISAGTEAGAAETAPVLRTGAPQPSAGGSVPGREPDLATAAAPHPTGGIGQPASYCKPGYCDTPEPRVVVSKGTGDTLRGSATWYAWHPGEAAAGPGLRAWLGADWRGKVVTVIAPGCTCAPIVVRLTDWCLCGGGRVIDLDRRSFAALIDPSFGVISVLISEGTP